MGRARARFQQADERLGAALASAAAGAPLGLHGVDPVAFLVVPTILVGVAALAVFIPARRASAVEPVRALKAE